MSATIFLVGASIVASVVLIAIFVRKAERQSREREEQIERETTSGRFLIEFRTDSSAFKRRPNNDEAADILRHLGNLLDGSWGAVAGEIHDTDRNRVGRWRWISDEWEED